MDVNYLKLAAWIIKYRLRYPRFKNKCMDFSEPNTVNGLTDHPLDKNAAPAYEIFTILRKFLARKPISVLAIELKQRECNSFIFRAKGFDIIRDRDLSASTAVYLTGEKTKHTECTLRLDILNNTAFRLRLSMGKKVPPHETPMVSGSIKNEGFNADLTEHPDRYIVSTSDITLYLYKENFKIKIYDKNGSLVTESGSRTHNEFPNATDAFPMGFVKNRKPKKLYAVENFNLQPGEAIYGLGEKFGPMNRVGQTISLWIQDGLGNTSPRTYKYIPFYLSSQGYGVFFNDYSPMTFWVGTKETSKIQVAIQSNLLDYYFFYGPEPKKILGLYTALTGRAAIPSRWSFGTWISRLSYGSQDEVIETAKRLRNEKYPSDVINIDTNWSTQEWVCDWRFDKKRFPDPKRMFKECRDLGFRICLWQIPYVVNTLAIKKEGKKRKAFAKNHGPFIFLLFGPVHAIDFSKKEGIAWYKEKLKELFDLGASVIKVDFGEQIQPHQEFSEYSGREMHNLYPLLYSKAAFEATEEHLGKGNAVIWARSAYAGSQRYPVHWSGDNSSNFSNMLTSLRAGLSMGLCGFTFWSQDTGGFVGIPDDKLYMRWTALSIFQSHFRFHGCEPKYREPWNFSGQAQDVVRKFLELRYRLIPYLFSESIKAARAGLPLMRSLFLEFPDDPNVMSIEDQFCCGENLMVAPVLTEMDSRRLYLPDGLWYSFWSRKSIKGSKWITKNSPVSRIPLYARAGSFLPMGETMQFVPDCTPKKIKLLAFPDGEKPIEYTLHDELGSVQFRGKIKGSKLHVKIVYLPQNRERLKVEVKLPPEHKNVCVEIR